MGHEHHMNYTRVSSSGRARYSSSSRGFRLNPRKLFILRLHKRFNFILRLFHFWKFSCVEAIKLLKRLLFIKRNNSSSRRRIFMMKDNEQQQQSDDYRMQIMRSSYGAARSNSFYAEAIADCLEFIKRTSMDQIQDPISHIQDRNS